MINKKIIVIIIFIFNYGFSNDFKSIKNSFLIENFKVKGDSLNLKHNIFFNLNCRENIIVNDIESSTSFLYWVSNSILLKNNYKVLPNYKITTKAGKVIILKPNVTLLKGCNFLARIESCENNCNFEFPKGISPNNDGKNETLDLTNLCKILKLKIYNRYGTLVFEQDNYTNQWHGQDYNNNELPDATYYYYVKLENSDEKTGWIFINK